MKFIVGLGNPGKRYQETPHNVGFLVVDRFARENSFSEAEKQFHSEVRQKRLAGGDRIFLLKPLQFMNLSGPPVRSMMDFFKGSPADLLVIHDDLDMPFGQLRLRASGSSGGHKGLASILDAFGTDAIQRLKIGIGRDPGKDPADFVLAPVPAPRQGEWKELIQRAVDAVGLWAREGFDRTAAKFNVRVQGNQ